MNVRGLVTAAFVVRRALVLVMCIRRQRVFVDVAIVYVVQMPIV